MKVRQIDIFLDDGDDLPLNIAPGRIWRDNSETTTLRMDCSNSRAICFARSLFCSGVPALLDTLTGAEIFTIGAAPPERVIEAVADVRAAPTRPPPL